MVVEAAVVGIKIRRLDALLAGVVQRVKAPQYIAGHHRLGAHVLMPVAQAGHVHRAVEDPVPLVLVVAAAQVDLEGRDHLAHRHQRLLDQQAGRPGRWGHEIAVGQDDQRLLLQRVLAAQRGLQRQRQPVGGPVDDAAEDLGLEQQRVVGHPAVQVVVAAVGERRIQAVVVLVAQACRRRPGRAQAAGFGRLGQLKLGQAVHWPGQTQQQGGQAAKLPAGGQHAVSPRTKGLFRPAPGRPAPLRAVPGSPRPGRGPAPPRW